MCTKQQDQTLTYTTALLQYCDLYKPALPLFLAHSNSLFPLLPSSSSGFRVPLQVQSSLAEYRLYSTTALAPDEQAGPDISLLSPLLQSQWDHPANAHLGSVVVKPHVKLKVWWTCSQCPRGHPHKWLAAPNSRSASKGKKGTGCPFCANRKVCQHNFLHTKAPHLTPEWSEKNELSPSNFLVRSNKKAWWQCECGYEWEATINSRTGGTGCPDCATQRSGGVQKRHPTLTESQHDMMHLWNCELNEEVGLDFSKLRCRSNKKAHWICNKCPMGIPTHMASNDCQRLQRPSASNTWLPMLRATRDCKLASATRSSLWFQRWLLSGTMSATRAPLLTMQPSLPGRSGGTIAIAVTSKPVYIVAHGAG